MNADILRIVNDGGNVTHILNIDVSTSDENNKIIIMDYIYNFINNKAIKKNFNNQVIEVTWKTFDKKKYYTDSLFFSDIGIKHHTSILMNDLSIFAKNTIKDFDFVINYSIEKPLSKKVILL
jgi:hypothetical protein